MFYSPSLLESLWLKIQYIVTKGCIFWSRSVILFTMVSMVPVTAASLPSQFINTHQWRPEIWPKVLRKDINSPACPYGYSCHIPREEHCGLGVFHLTCRWSVRGEQLQSINLLIIVKKTSQSTFKAVLLEQPNPFRVPAMKAICLRCHRGQIPTHT